MDSLIWQVIGPRFVFALAAAGLGALIAVSLKRINHLILCVLISFAAGALLAVTVLDIIPESYHMTGFWKTLLSVASGYLLFLFITRFVFHVCPACAATHTEVQFTAVTVAMLVALSVHSFMDGLAIYSGYASGEQIGTALLAAVSFHKFPEGLALALVARASGINRPKAFGLSFGIELITTLAGGIVGILFLVPEETVWIGIVLGHVGGGFIFLVIHALLSEALKHHPKPTIAAAVLGALCVGLVMLYTLEF